MQRVDAFLAIDAEDVKCDADAAKVKVSKRKGQVRSEALTIEYERIRSPGQFSCKFGAVPDCPVAVFDIMKARSKTGKLA